MNRAFVRLHLPEHLYHNTMKVVHIRPTYTILKGRLNCNEEKQACLVEQLYSNGTVSCMFFDVGQGCDTRAGDLEELWPDSTWVVLSGPFKQVYHNVPVLIG